MSGIVAIVGRPNVGKSTLFNRLVLGRKAIVDDQAGVTRDRHYSKSTWNGREFNVIDTGGYVHGSDDIFEAAIRSQVIAAIEESDVLLFMVDTTTGITDHDEAFADVLRRTKKPILVVANKVDTNEMLNDIHEFYGFGFGELFPVCSASGSGTGELLDRVVELLPPDVEESPSDLPRFALVGRPNVGKSTLLNALTGQERTIVTPIAGTTRDTINTEYKYFGKNFYLVDTAGLRKKAKVNEDIEFYSVMRTIRAIEECDVVMLLIDATEGLQAQDLNILHLATRNRKGAVILVNKWDLVEKETNTARDYEAELKKRLLPHNDVSILFISATEKQRIFKAVEAAIEVHDNRKKKIKTSELNDVLLPEIEAFPPPSHRGHYIKIKYITQLPSPTPAFAFFCNHPKEVKEPYRRFLENKLRQKFNFTGVPISIYLREK